MGEVRCQGWLCSHPQPNPGLVLGFGVPGRPRLLERARTCPRSDSVPQCRSSSGERTAGVAEGHRLQDQHLPKYRQLSLPHSCPKSQGCFPTHGLGSEFPREPRKSQRRQLQNEGSPFIAQPSRAHPPPQSQGAGRQPQSSAQPSKQDHRAAGNGGLGAGGSPMVSPLLLSQALQPKSG